MVEIKPPPSIREGGGKEKEIIDPHDIGFVTATMYDGWEPLRGGQKRDPDDIVGVRGDLALQTIKQAVTKGFQVVVVDSPRSSEDFKDALANIENVSIHQETEKTMSGGRRQGFELASALQGAKVISWVEPEKISMVDSIVDAARPIIEDQADIVIPKRNETLFEDYYPDYQVDFERRANNRFNHLLRISGLQQKTDEPFDAWFGPRLIKNDPRVLDHFLQANIFKKPEESKVYATTDPELWQDALFLPIPSALHAGLRVKSVTVDYIHPSKQTAIEKDSPALKDKRQKQYRDIIFATSHFLKRLAGRPSRLQQIPR